MGKGESIEHTIGDNSLFKWKEIKIRSSPPTRHKYQIQVIKDSRVKDKFIFKRTIPETIFMI